jgi:hypothetical protein
LYNRDFNGFWHVFSRFAQAANSLLAMGRAAGMDSALEQKNT